MILNIESAIFPTQEARRLSNTEESNRRRAKERHKEADKSSKREKSLLEIHQSKMAKRKKVTDVSLDVWSST